MTLTRHHLSVIATAAAAVLLLGACAAPAAETTPGSSTAPDATAAATQSTASQERTLIVYSGRDEELVAPLIEQFEQASGITTEVRYAGSGELAAQLLEEGDRSPAQVFLSQDSGALGAVAAEGLFETLPQSITSLVASEYTSRDGSWVGLTGRARVIAYDSERYTAEQIPGDVFQLLEPEWNGAVGIAPGNASFQSFVTAIRVSEGEERARAWLEGLVANDVQVYERNGELLEAVNTGALDVALINHYYWARSEQDPQTLRAQLKFGDPGSISALVNVTGAGVLAGGASEEATEFVEFLVSDVAQRYFLEETYEYPLAIDASPAGVPALAELGGPDVDLSELSSLQQTVDLIVEVGLL